MSVVSFTTLKAEISNYADEAFSSTDADTFITLAEDRINRDLRITAMETALSVTISSGVAALPADFRELKNAYIDGNPIYSLEMAPLDWLYKHYPVRASSGKPTHVAVEGTNLVFGPYPDSAYTVKGTYYASFAQLSAGNETNFLTATAKALLLYACLVHATEFNRDDNGNQRWLAAYERELARVKSEDVRTRWGSGMTLRSRAS